jgi:hypothetical protein
MLTARRRRLVVACAATAVAVGGSTVATSAVPRLVPPPAQILHRLTHGGHHGGNGRGKHGGGGWTTHDVPKSIPHNCGKSANHKLTNWFAKLPSHSIVEFPHHGCYHQKNSVTVSDAHQLKIHGNGSHFRGTMKKNSSWTITNSHHVTLHKLHVTGNDKDSRHKNAHFHPNREYQHGFRVLGSNHVTLKDISVSNVWGDGVIAGPANRGLKSVPTQNLTVTHAKIDGTGRHGMSVVDGKHIALRHSTISHNQWEGIDVEPAQSGELAKHIVVKDNQFGVDRLGMFANYGESAGHHVGHMKIIDNVQTAAPISCRPPVSMSTPSGHKHRSHYVIEDNQFDTFGTALTALATKHVDFEHNTVVNPPGTTSTCGLQPGVTLDHSSHDVVTHNSFGVNINQAVELTDCRLVKTAHNILDFS